VCYRSRGFRKFFASMPQGAAEGGDVVSQTVLLTSFAALLRTPCGGDLRSLLLPATTEGLIDLDKRQSFIELRLDQIQLRRVIAGFARQHLEITRAPLLV